jgi:hypothetical protein
VSARPLTLRLYERAPFSPAWLGALLAIAYLAALAAFVLVAGRYSEVSLAEAWERPGWWAELVNAALFGLGPTILVVSARGAERDVRDLAPVLGSPAALEAAQARVARLPAMRMRVVGAVVVLAAIAFTWLDPGLWSSRVRPPATDPFFLWTATRHGLLGWIWSRAMYADVSGSRAFAGIAAELREIDLLDLRPLTPFARRGVRSVLFWMLGASLFSLFWAAPNAGRTNVVSFAFFVSVAAAALLLPLLAIRRRIRAAKDEALARLRAEIRADQRALLERGAAAAPAAARLPALLAAEARTASVRELPLDASTLVRFALYAALGLGSWLGGALVELGLGSFLE